MKKLYAQRNPRKQGKHYTDHVMAMTGEELHKKSDIAAELAHRDIVIEQLRNACMAMVTAQHAGPITDEMLSAWSSARKLLKSIGADDELYTH